MRTTEDPPSAMTSGPSEVLALQNEVALLRGANAELAEANAALVAENETLKTRLSELEASGGSEEDAMATNCGHTAGALSVAAADEPTLPNEIFLMVAEYYKPGSRSLANLARTCRSLYELLVPKLYEHFEVANLYLKIENLCSRKWHRGKDSPTLPHGLTLVIYVGARTYWGVGGQKELVTVFNVPL